MKFGAQVTRTATVARIDGLQTRHLLGRGRMPSNKVPNLEDEARRRALQGVEKPVFREGRQVGTVTEYSDTLLIFLLKARRPEKFRDRARFEALNKKSAGGAGRPAASSVRFRFRRAIPGLALPLRDYLEASHSHERHTVHGLHEHKSHEQDVPCGDGNKGCRLCSSGQSFQPID